jgi:hypothetical protein
MKLPPRGSAGATISYSFRFLWARDFAAVRDVLPFQGKFDTTVVPGMVIPTDLEASFSLRSRNSIAAVEAEHPAQTTIEPVGEKAGGIRVYRVRFSKLGENMLTIRYGDGLWTTLEFFVTEPIETLIRKRAAFLVSHQQHKDPGKWYVGVYSDWDQKNEVLRSPEDRDALSAWLTDANDDAANARQAFLASKNVFFRDQAEIASLELYISKYLWGGMQMTDAERYPYAIYGIPNWKANRASADPGRNGRAHVWRIYDYPHIIMLYYTAEEDVGYCGALRTHATIVARDPVFGEIAYGGVLTRDGSEVKVIPRDGLRVRFHIARGDQRFHMTLDRDGYVGDQPIRVSDDLSSIRFPLENRAGRAHQTTLTVRGLPPGNYAVGVDDRAVGTVDGAVTEAKIALPIGAGATARVAIVRTQG